MMKTIVSALILLIMFPISSYSGQIGTVAPAFSLVDLNGKVVALEQFKGKVVFLNFWALWCGPCKEELPELDALFRKYREEGFDVIGVSVDPSGENVARFLQKKPVSFTILIDKKGDVADAYLFSSLPTGFIIGRDGTIKYKHMGFGKEFLPIFEKEITGLLKQENIILGR
jgi:peroxiredoxin